MGMFDASINSMIEKHDVPPIRANMKGDRHNIFLLLVLYTLQGVPLGFSLAIPIFLQNMHLSSSFKEQAKFSMSVWPFSMKLLWAPLVDSLFSRKLGRRKSWLVPTQYFLGVSFIILGFHINEWLVKVSQPEINFLTFMFFILNFLAATQDIIVDGWGISMLKRENISYAPMCNSAGQAFGIFLGYVLLIMLTSETFCNQWLRSSPLPDGLITLQGYFYFWGVTFMIITTLVAIFKHEKDNLTKSDAANFSMIKTYKLLVDLIKLPSIRKLALILLSVKISFSSVDAAFKLKLIDGGVTKDQIATIEFLLVPLRIILPLFINRFMSKDKPLNNYLETMLYRLVVGVAITVVIYFTPYFVIQTGALLIAYKVILVLMYFTLELVVCFMTLTIITFYATISDPQIGGTNMTLLTTLGNLGTSWSRTGALWLIELLTYKQCSKNVIGSGLLSNDTNTIMNDFNASTCHVIINGFYVETLICTVYGVIWYYSFKKTVNELQSKNEKEWRCIKSEENTSMFY